MEKSDKEPRTSGGGEANAPRRNNSTWLIFLVIAGIAAILFLRGETPKTPIPYSFFQRELERGNIESVQIAPDRATGRFKTAPLAPQVYRDGQLIQPKGPDGKPLDALDEFEVVLPQGRDVIDRLTTQLEANDVYYEAVPADNTFEIVYMALLFGLLLGVPLFFIMMLRRTRNDMMGGGGFLSGFSKSPAKRYEGADQIITFKDVAGLEGVKADLQEIVDYLKSPEKFRKLGGRVPRGVLLNGPPGTGKTLLARAVAGEANAPFFSVNGSEFIQMFVGVGASRVRDLFKTAKEQSPAIIFIDEIDAVGRQRGAGLGGGHDEREQTLNQILGEMDGFSPNQAVIVVAATNRPDVLDPALLRPGRFDRHVTVGRPTLKGREEIFKVHVRDVPLADDVDLHRLAAGTVGLTGADIRNLVNEAALWAARNDKQEVTMEDFDYARDKILMGAKREEVLQESEKEKTAYHEAGHTLTAWHLDGGNIVHKVTIIPRGRALGATQYLPVEDRLSISKRELEDQLIVLLGGRAAEKIIYDETTVGAENDLERATSIARRMVTHWGMSPKLGPVSYKTSDEDPFLGREIHQQRHFSEHTQETIDEEVARILHQAAEGAEKMLTDRREELERLTRALIEREELSEAEITDLIGPSIHARRSQRNGKPETVMAPESAADHSPGPIVPQRSDANENDSEAS
ncbi:ATP-dependent zinc metalloprotease FtsH [Candidatus Laterigemmans baculatus]|uniref:ATP-dependent zinc metalloprotease FtsH n=1 Tax=Candidatus Laterigemmans baculatus TaxID=2770505 RepID=UPI0013DCC30B|nr:ATP-dependent zinc metalloprotease FtsH [Candidatus Laterigemmans baculatus]